MAITPGVVGTTRSDLQNAQAQRAFQAAQLGATVAGQIADRNEMARQFDIEKGLPAALGSNETLYELLQTEEGRAVAAPFVQKLTGIRDPKKLHEYMMAVALSPQDLDTLRRAATNAFVTGRVTQGAGAAPQATPDYMTLARDTAMRYRPAAPGGPVVAAGGQATPEPSGDRTLAPTAPAGVSAPPPVQLGQAVTGTGTMASGSVIPASVAVTGLTPAQALHAAHDPEAAGYQGALGLSTAAPGTAQVQKATDDLMYENLQGQRVPKVSKAELEKIMREDPDPARRQAAFNILSSQAAPVSTPAGEIVTSDYNPDGTLKAGVAPPGVTVQGATTETPTPLRKDMTFREFLIEKQKAGALGGAPVNPKGTDDAGLVANNTGSYQEWERFRRGETPTWVGKSATTSAASSAAAAVGKAGAEGSASLSEYEKFIASYYYTIRAQQGDTAGLERAGLTALSGADMARAERLLSSQVREESADVVRTWRANPKLGKQDMELAQQHAQTLQIIGGNLPAELNPMLTEAMTNWADIDRRTKEATIKQLETSAGLNEAQAKYYLDRLRIEAAGDTLDYMARMDEGSKKLLTGVIDLFNGVYKESIQGIYKIADPKKRTEAIAKLVDSDPILKSAFTAYQRSISWMLNTPITPESTQYLYGGFLGLGKKQGSTVLGSVELGGSGSGSDTDAAAEAAGYFLDY